MKPPHPTRMVSLCAALLLITAVGDAADGADALAGAAPLTALAGDPARGRLVVRDTSKASCLICHAMPIAEEPDHGTIGPPLQGIARRSTAQALRQRIVDATAVNPDTVMPPYFRSTGFHRVLARFDGQSIYSAQDVEDVVAYLMTLTGE